MAIFHRASHAPFGAVAGSGRGGECALDLSVVEGESSSLPMDQRTLLLGWRERLAFVGLLMLLAFVGIGVVTAHWGIR